MHAFRLAGCAFALALLLAPRAAAQTIDLEDLQLPPRSFYNGSDRAGGFFSQGAFFNNDYNPMFGSWSGWSYSNMTDVTTPGFGNQYSAYHLPNGGGDRSSNYAVCFNSTPGDAFLILPTGTRPASCRITNTTYAGLSMRFGDAFAKRFGGPTGTDPDYFILSIYGFDFRGNFTGVVHFLLADYTSDDPTQDYIVAQWTPVDLTPLGNAEILFFGLISSDNGMFGMNTPAYFALDNLEVTRR